MSAPLTPRGLVTRVTRSVAAPAAVIALIVLALAIFAAAAPRVLEAAFTASIRYDIDENSLASQRELSGSTLGGPVPGPSRDPAASGLDPAVDAVWGTQRDGLADLRLSMPETLRSAVNPAQVATSFDQQEVLTPEGQVVNATALLSLGFDPDFTSRIRLERGELPALYEPGDDIADMVLSEDSATAADWRIGDARLVGGLTVRLTGIFSVLDVDDEYWSHATGLATHTTTTINGEQFPVVQAFLDPSSFSAIDAATEVPARTTVWFGLDSSKVTASNAGTIAVEAREFLSVAHPLPVAGSGNPFDPSQGVLTQSSQLPDFLASSLDRTVVTLQSIAMLVAGPLGAFVAILVLASLLFVRRQAPTLHLLTARGATRAQLAAIAGTSTILVVLPAAIVGTVVGIFGGALVGGALIGTDGAIAVSVADVALPLVLSVAAAALVASLSLRSEHAADSRSRVGRLVAEIVVIALAVTSVVVLAQRAPSVGDGETRPFDPLLAAEPLLLVLVGGIGVLRLYPLIVRRLVTITRRQRGIVGFLGAAESSAQSAGRSAGGPVTALAVVIGVSIAVFSGSLLTTLRTGILDSSETSVGSDLTVTSRVLTEEQSTAIGELPGIESMVTLYTSKDEQLMVGADRDTTHIIVVDTATLREIQAGTAGAIELPDAVAEQVQEGDAVPVVLSDVAAEEIGTDELEIYGSALDVVGIVPGETALTPRTNWILIDQKNEDVLLDAYTANDHLLAKVDPAADPVALAESVRAIVGEYGSVSTPAGVSAVQRGSPAIAALDTVVVIAIIASGIACAIAIIMTLGLGAAARARLIGLLSALGIGRREARALTAWEIAPIAITAVIAGTLIGVVLPFLVIAGTDLRPFTAGLVQPSITIDPLLTVIVVGAFCLVVVLAVAASALASRTTGTARAIRSTEEG